MKQSPQRDIVTVDMFHGMWDTVTKNTEKGIEMPNPWIIPSTAPEEWWVGLPVGKVDILVGGNEILRDDILIAGRALKVCLAPRCVG